MKQRELLWGAFGLALAGLLLCRNLGNQYLWCDEAQTALLAKSMLLHHLPLGHDGLNSLSTELGAEFGPDDVYRWSPWLSLAAVAASFKLFGFTAFAARLPFALCGLATVALCYFFAKELWGRRIAALSATLLTISVPFLLLSRQSRYYAMTTLFSLICLNEYVLIVRGKRRSAWALTGALVLLFYTQNVYFGVVVLALLFHLALFRDQPRKQVAIAIAVSGLLAIPWVRYASSVHYRTVYPGMLTPGQLVRFAPTYVLRAATLFNGWALASLGLVAVALTRLRRQRLSLGDTRGLALLASFTAATLFVLGLTSAAPFFRYLAPLCPIAAITTALLLDRIFDWDLRAGVIALLAIAGLSELPSFLYELSHDFDGPLEGVSKYLNAHAASSDTVAITYGDLTAKFYTGLRVIGGLTGEDLSPAKDANWIIIRKHVVCSKDEAVRAYLLANVDWSRYREIQLAYPDTIFENREDPGEHLFRTATNVPPVIMYERVR